MEGMKPHFGWFLSTIQHCSFLFVFYVFFFPGFLFVSLVLLIIIFIVYIYIYIYTFIYTYIMYVMSYLDIPGSLLFLWLSHLNLLGSNLDQSVSKTIIGSQPTK